MADNPETMISTLRAEFPKLIRITNIGSGGRWYSYSNDLFDDYPGDRGSMWDSVNFDTKWENYSKP